MAVNCSVCLKNYESQELIQRTLPCSHKCCDECLALFIIKNAQKCHVCQKDWLSVDLLGRAESKNLFNGLKESDTKNSNKQTQHTPLPRRSVVEAIRQSNQQIALLVNEKNRHSSPSQELAEMTKVNCSSHGLPPMIWCTSCNTSGCKTCLSLNHSTCNWLLLEEDTRISQLNNEERTKVIFDRVSERIDYLKQIHTECKKKKDLMGDFARNICKLAEDVGKFDYFLYTAIEIHSIDVKSIFESIKECVNATGVNSSFIINEKLNRIEHILKNTEKLPHSNLFHLWNIIAIYKEMSSEIKNENFIEMFCNRLKQETIRKMTLGSEYIQESQETFENEEENDDSPIIRELKKNDSGQWFLTNDAMADAACHLLLETSVRPGKVVINVCSDDSWSEAQLNSLLQVLSDKLCDVYLQFTDLLDMDSEKADLMQIKRLNQLKFKQMRCTLKSYFGRTSPKLLQVLPKTVENLILSIHHSNDFLNIPFIIKKNVKNNKFNAGNQLVLKQLGLIFRINISSSELKVLDFENCSSLKTLNITFEQMHKGNFDMLINIIRKISLPKKPVTNISVTFVQCALSEDDFDLLLGRLRDFSVPTYQVCYTWIHLDPTALARIKERYALFNIKFLYVNDAYLQV